MTSCILKLISELDTGTGFEDTPDAHVFATISFWKTFKQNNKLLFEKGLSTVMVIRFTNKVICVTELRLI